MASYRVPDWLLSLGIASVLALQGWTLSEVVALKVAVASVQSIQNLETAKNTQK